MEEEVELPRFYEDKQVESKSVYLAKYSGDGKLLAVVHTDYSLSIWDSCDILVSISPNRSNSFHVVFLDWSASSKFLYLIVDYNGFLIDVYGNKTVSRNFTFDQSLNSFSCHPDEDRLCLVTCLDKLIELNINNDSHTTIMNYRELSKTDMPRKAGIPSYAQYSGIDDTILLWLQGHLYLVHSNGEIIKSIQVKPSSPLQQRIRIDRERRICLLATRNELITVSLPDLEIQSSYRDSVNDSPWRSIDLLPHNRVILTIPENYVLDGPVFYILSSEGELEVAIYREPKQKLLWGIFHPSGRSVLFCTDHGDMILFKREEKGFRWNGPMYPLNFTYLNKCEAGPDVVDDAFEETYFPKEDGSHGKAECRISHHIDIMSGICEKPFPFHLDLVPGEEERVVYQNDNILPSPLEDIYGHR